MTTLTAIVVAIVAALAVDLGTFDLSGTDQVKEGTFANPPGSVAFACVLPATLTDSVAQARGSWYLETWTCTVRAWAPNTGDTTADHAARSRLLGAELVKGLDAARDNQSSALWKCVRWAVTGVEHDPAAFSAPAGWARAQLTITFSYRRGSGTGA